MHNSLSDSLEELVRTLEPLRHDSPQATDPQPGPRASPRSVEAWRSIEALARRYEVVVWEVVMPHLIRNAPQLAPEIVTTLQKNHQLEKELMDELSANASPNGASRNLPPAALLTRLVNVLRETLGIGEADVSAALGAMPEEQRSAPLAVMEHERARVDGEADEPDEAVVQASDALETDRSSLPIPAAERY